MFWYFQIEIRANSLPLPDYQLAIDDINLQYCNFPGKFLFKSLILIKISKKYIKSQKIGNSIIL